MEDLLFSLMNTLKKKRKFIIAELAPLHNPPNLAGVRACQKLMPGGRLSSLKPVKLKNPDLILGLMGCMVGYRDNAEIRKRLPYVDVFAPPSNPKPIIDYLLEKEYIGDRADGKKRALPEIWNLAQLTLPPSGAQSGGQRVRSDRLRLFACLRVLHYSV